MELDLTPQQKRLYSEIINSNGSKKSKYLISTENFVLILPEDSPKALCVKKLENDWETKCIDAKKALNIIGLDIFNDEVFSDEGNNLNEDEETDEVDELDNYGI